MKKMMMTLAAVLCCALTTTSFMACSSDDDDPVEEKTVVKYTYKLTIEPATDADDQQDIVKTIINSPNNKGEMNPHEFSSYTDLLILSPGSNLTEVPASHTITIDETLIPDVNLTKESYKLGLSYKLEVTSFDKNDGVIDYKGKGNDSRITVPAANLGKIYPKTITLKFSVDEKGQISL